MREEGRGTRNEERGNGNSQSLQNDLESNHLASRSGWRKFCVITGEFVRARLKFMLHERTQWNIEILRVLQRVDIHWTLVSENQHGVRTAIPARMVGCNINMKCVGDPNTIDLEHNTDNLPFGEICD